MSRTSDPGHIFGPVFIPGCAAVRLVWTLNNGKQASNVLHGSYTAAPPNTQVFINGLMTSITAALISSGLSVLIHTGVKLAFVGVRDMAETSPGSGVGHGEIISNLTAVAGTAPAADPLPASISFVVSLKTGLSLQANRGRVYLTGFTEGGNDPGGNASAAVIAAAPAFVTAVQASMHSNGLELCIAHPARAAYDSPPGVDPALQRHHPARAPGTVLVSNIASLNNVWDSTRLRQMR